jgi:acyl-CoA thioesterase FadM
MNLWLRFFLVLLTAWRRKRVKLFDVSTIHLRVLPNDLDLNGHINNGRYLTLADLGRIDYMLRTGLVKVFLKRRAQLVVGDALAKFRRDLKVFERFTLETRLAGWDEKWVFFEQRFIRAGRVCTLVAVRIASKHPKGGLINPGEFITDLGLPDVSPALPDWMREWSQSCEAASVYLRQEERSVREIAEPQPAETR